ncbi:MAG: XRE family transcriptional regulator [Gammaproteobacteria bacterium]|nr:XRE family transcriptional regulator [Gammaproteobacteria bacterium]
MDSAWTGRARQEMRSRGISQQELARELGCTRGAVGHYLSGRRSPSLEQMEIIARFLQVDLMWLLRGNLPGRVAESAGADSTSAVHVPIMGSTASGPMRDPSGQLGTGLGSRPCYGLKVSGSDYSPRLYAGEIAVLDPAAAPVPGDEVFIRFRDGGLGLYSLVNRGDARITLESLAGERARRRVDVSDVQLMHKLIAVFRADEG